MEDKRYLIKTDNPGQYYNMFLLETIKLENGLIEIYAKVETKVNIYTKIKLVEIKPEDIKENQFYYIIGEKDNIFQKTFVKTKPIHNINLKTVRFQGEIYGEQKLIPRGGINFLIPLTLNTLKIFIIEPLGEKKRERK